MDVVSTRACLGGRCAGAGVSLSDTPAPPTGGQWAGDCRRSVLPRQGSVAGSSTGRRGREQRARWSARETPRNGCTRSANKQRRSRARTFEDTAGSREPSTSGRPSRCRERRSRFATDWHEPGATTGRAARKRHRRVRRTVSDEGSAEAAKPLGPGGDETPSLRASGARQTPKFILRG